MGLGSVTLEVVRDIAVGDIPWIFEVVGGMKFWMAFAADPGGVGVTGPEKKLSA